MAEALAIREAIFDANSRKFSSVLIQSDSLQIIQAINSGSPLSELHGVLGDISKSSVNFSSVSFKFIPRTENIVADSLAQQTLSEFVRNTG
ncbi:hypothetical protein EUTSA_v10003494mg [Eutrema salsugineum]|uniref:RNase H type-1 domain-containing protein n=1 Tax=Eutrema salsugineum TaxID=72664 RepID=V4LLA8_EUTSA|nr:hypothetical protein EUTSA_v10003494mg [Eutrema salsugineum]